MEKKKLLNTFNVFSVGLSGAIGSGIFVLLGLGIGYTGKSIVLAVSVGCLFMLFAYVFHVIMSSMFVLRGGIQSMRTLLLDTRLLGSSTFLDLIQYLSLAMYGIAIIQYASMVFPSIEPYSEVCGVLLVTMFFLLAARGSKFVGTLISIMTVVLIASISLFIIFGFGKVETGYFASEGFFSDGIIGFFSAMSIMSWACQGTTMAPSNFSGDTKNAKKTTPKAILLITLALACIYGLMAYVAAGVLPVEEIAGENLATVSAAIFPHWAWALFILGGAVFAISTSLFSTIGMLSKPLMKMANDGWLPKSAAKTTKSGFPWVLQLALYLVNVVPIVCGASLEFLVSLAMIPSMLICIYCNFALLKIVKKYPKHWKSSILHMPYPALIAVVAIAILCDAIVIYNLFIALSVMEMVLIVVLALASFVYSEILMKAGSINLDVRAVQDDIVVDSDLLEVENA